MTTEELRKALSDYYGTAVSSGNPMAVVELSRVRSASGEELLCVANKLGWIKKDER